MERIRAAAPRTIRTLVRAGLIAVLVAGLVGGTALAAKGGGGGGKPGGGGTSTGGGSITGYTMIYDQNGSGTANWADTIKFTFTTSNTAPYINLYCATSSGSGYSSSHLVYWPNIWNDPGYFYLQSPSWMGGSASCTATLYGSTSTGGTVKLGTYGFSVAG